MMSLRSALEVIAADRGRRIVVTTMAAVGEWPAVSDHPLDFHFLPSSMGQGPAVGLGLALARPDHGVVVICGDGSLLMNLGCLVTLADHDGVGGAVHGDGVGASPIAPLVLVVIDNGLYEVTGGQELVGAGRTDYPGLARSAGIRRVYSFDGIDDWRAAAPAIFASTEVVFVHLRVEGTIGKKTPKAPRSAAEQVERLTRALADSKGRPA